MNTKLTTKSQEAVTAALQAASAAGNPQVEPLHLLNVLLEDEGGIALALLEAAGADRKQIGAHVRKALVALPSSSGSSVSEPSTSRALLNVITQASE
ncbi:ATP-dependent chaperone ClpB, partial [Bacillus cereus]|nr:ATP-dependent chaperone ClpB [Bacillus cereus]